MSKELEKYANELVEKLIAIKDANRDTLTWSEIDALNDAANLIYHNRKVLKEM